MYGALEKPISNVQKATKSNVPMYNNTLFIFVSTRTVRKGRISLHLGLYACTMCGRRGSGRKEVIRKNSIVTTNNEHAAHLGYVVV